MRRGCFVIFCPSCSALLQFNKDYEKVLIIAERLQCGKCYKLFPITVEVKAYLNVTKGV
jgi:DNA-directed RNA polymerase subunit M/transcription elongation factor TFIIS